MIYKKKVYCSNCHVEFYVYKHRDKHKKTQNYFCSQKCHKEWKYNSNNPNWKGGLGVVVCEICGKKVKRKKHEIAKYKHNYCSEQCRIEGSKTLVTTVCECCGKEIERTKKYTDKYQHFFCNRDCRSAWMCGENNSAWNGGTKSLKYCSAWSDQKYKDELKKRDNYHCLNPNCWGSCDDLVLHHIDYDKQNCNPKNLITLCVSCNARANINRDWHQKWYQNIMYQRYGYCYEKAA